MKKEEKRAGEREGEREKGPRGCGKMNVIFELI
jgi:hypothetical protein